jgi:hypothetical protein
MNVNELFDMYDTEQNGSLSYKELVGGIFGNNSLTKEDRPESRQQQNQNKGPQRKEGSKLSFIEREE